MLFRSNSLIGKIIREGSCQVKESFEELLAGRNIITQIDEQIVYNRLDLDENAIWSLFLASGHLKIVNEVKCDACLLYTSIPPHHSDGKRRCTL